MNKRLFVGNLEYSITNEELEELFSTEGTVAAAKVIRALDGKSKGFGFVEMETEEEAAKAMEKFNQSTFKDRILLVNEAKPQTNKPGGFNGDRRKDRYGRKQGGDDLNSKLRKLRRRR